MDSQGMQTLPQCPLCANHARSCCTTKRRKFPRHRRVGATIQRRRYRRSAAIPRRRANALLLVRADQLFPRCRTRFRSKPRSWALTAITRTGFCGGRPGRCRRPIRIAANFVSTSRTSCGVQSEGDLSEEHPGRRSHHPLRSLAPLGFADFRAPFSWEQDCCPEITCSTSTAGARSSRPKTSARCPPRRPSHPSSLGAASNSKGADRSPT